MPRPIYDLLLKGQNVVIKGTKDSYQISKSLNNFTYKGFAKQTSTLVILKFEAHPVTYRREVNVYQFQCISRSPYIRSLHEVIDNEADKCMVFEWMEDDLWSLRRQDKIPINPILPKVVAKSVLNALMEIEYMDGQGPGIHSDINPNNILVSGAHTSLPIVKVSDFNGLLRANKQQPHRFQGLEIRAPEIWKTPFSSSACDVWSLGVTLVHCLIGKCIFGASDLNIRIEAKSPEVTEAAWCIGKIMNLVGPFSRDEDSEFKDDFDTAESLVKQSAIKVRPLKEELIKFDVPEDTVQFIRHLLVMDPEKRPTAKQALNHPWLQDAKESKSP